MRRVILCIAAILITFAIGVGADRVWWYFLAAPPQPTRVEPAFDFPIPPALPPFIPAAPPPPPAPITPKANLILDYDPEKFSLWAAFEIMGSKPKAFADVHSFEVMLSPGSKEYPGSISVLTKVGDKYDIAPATFGLVTESRMFFTTSELSNSDFEYRFDGEFLRTDFDKVAGKNKPVLSGTLTKMKKGRTIAEQAFSFRMYYMGC